jgi:inosose dehydratase
MKLGHQVNTWAGWFKQRGEPFDLRRVCRDVAQAGYDGVELGADPESTGDPRRVQRLLDEHGLRLPALATSVTLNPHPPATEKFRTGCAYARQLGVSTLMTCGGFNAGKRRHAFEWEYEMFAENLDAHAKIAADHGCRLSYHPHLKCIVETDEELDRLLAYKPDVDLCIDTGHLIAAGADPLAMLRKHGERVTHVHLKDWDPVREAFTEIGDGSAGLEFTAFFAELDRQDYAGWVVVERDGPQMPPLESALASRAGVDAARSRWPVAQPTG